MLGFLKNNIKKFKEEETVFGNPLMGYAPNAWYSEIAEDISLLYMDVTWAELEPEEGVYNWSLIEQKNQTARWKNEGKHLILRFVCDVPGDEKHMDIPEWLYQKTEKAGKWYDGAYGKGFAPDYRNEVMISCHEKTVRALGEHFGQDEMISYIELGSLGHWGEWHVNYGIGLPRLPKEKIRDKYVRPWTEAFPEAMILMRRPFSSALKYHLGLYNDMSGYPEETDRWLEWINNGGVYEQTGEANALVEMKDFWKTTPSGGEFTSFFSMEEILQTNLLQTVQMIRKAHTTFLGPKIADINYVNGYKEILKNMGYRLWISKAEIKRTIKGNVLKLTWKNSGVAPLYKDWPVYIYFEDCAGKNVEKKNIRIKISSILPDTEEASSTILELKNLNSFLKAGGRIAIGIEDPMTGEPCVRLGMNTLYQKGKNYLW